MDKGRAWLIGICLLLPSAILAVAGVIELRDGSAVDAAFPVPNSLSNNSVLAKAAYVDAAEILRESDRRNGDAQISRAESMFYAGYDIHKILPVMENGLQRAPASAEGWTYYAAILIQADPRKAGLALDQALVLAPYEYFLAGARAGLGARDWPFLDEETKAAVLRQARLLWENPVLRRELPPLLATPDGARLLTRAYSGAPGTIREINRWMQAERRKSAQGS